MVCSMAHLVPKACAYRGITNCASPEFLVSRYCGNWLAPVCNELALLVDLCNSYGVGSSRLLFNENHG